MNKISSFARGACLLLALPILSAMPAVASVKLPTLTPERLVAEKSLDVSGLQWTDASHIAANVKVGDEATQRSWTLSGGSSRVLAVGEGRNSPDGTRNVSREQEEWVVRETQGARRVLARVPAEYGNSMLGRMAWSRDSRRIVLIQETRAKPAPLDTVSADDGVRYVDVGAQADARDAAGAFSSVMTIIDVDSPEPPRRLPFAGRLEAVEWGAQNDLYYVAQPLWNTDGAPLETVVRVLKDGKSQDVFRVGGIMNGIGPSISPDGRWLSVVCDIDSQRWDDFTSLLVVELATGQVRRLTRTQYVGGQSVRWGPDSRRLYYLTRDGGRTQINSVDLDGNSLALTESPTYKRELQLSPDGRRLAYVARDGLGRVELRTLAVATKQDTRVALLDDPTVRYQLGRFERVKFPTPDGVQIAAWVIYPPDFDASKKYPLYVDVHGGGPGSFLYLFGPISAVTTGSPLEWHTWAAKGYVVFVPDYRSSGEYGPGVAAARHRQRNGDFGGIEADMRDVDAGVEWLSKHPYIDASRIGVLGSSAGGARVNLLLTRSTRYRAGIIHDQIGAGVLPDFIGSLTGSRTGTTASRMFWETHVGKLADRPETYLGGFLFDGYKSKTPTLILVGGDRSRSLWPGLDPLSAEALFSILRLNRVPSRMLRYSDDGHGFMTPASARHAFGQIEAWLAEQMDIATDASGVVLFDAKGRVQPRAGLEVAADRS
ncbi:S9 family peptidase [Steroidobacter sp.]|uniref:S9 family peptidase n=1 Tax=Steroidobacter sp. TaxID=1978227 RepID=UPI001A3E736D|nr:prolyl oligopeptidase family serine peptidase [Steroidobacter sp.]MBL8268607.1 S9 family peptidase [Steroidobacter sp.]